MEVNKEHGPKASGCVTKKLFSFEEMPALYNIQKCLRIIFHLNNYLHLYIKQYKMETLELIKTLPPELREKIYKEFIKIKLRERKALGWDEVNAAIKEAPFCDHNQQIVKVLFCYKCGHCMRNYLCNLCRRNGVNHYLGYPIYDEDDYDECFKKSWYNSWCGAVA